MTIDTTEMFPLSADVSAMQSILQQNRDIRGGKQVMYLHRDNYFRKLDKQTNDEYDAMVDMAPVYTIYPKVVEGFVGTIFRKPISLLGADKFDRTNVDLLGNDLEEYCQQITRYVFEDGFCASMVDWNDSLNRSYFKMFKPEQFVSYMTGNSKGYPELTRFIYKEEVEEQDVGNEFSTSLVEYHNVIDLDENGYVRVRRYKTDAENESSQTVMVGEPVYLTKNGKNLTKLPIIIHSIKANNFTVEKSPLQDISDLNISVDQRVVDLVHMLHWSALPTPWATGVDPKNDKIGSIGPTQGWLIENDTAKVGMLEFSGDSYEAHISFIKELESTMAVIGAQILSPQAVSRETASSVIIRTSAQTSLIATIVDNISSQIQQIIAMKMMWDVTKYNEDELAFSLNRDFIQILLEPNAQISLVKSWIDGAISFDTMFEAFKKGEIIPAERTKEQELKLIKANPPPFFKENVESELNATANEGGVENQPAKDDTNGSSLETGTGVSNPATGAEAQ